MSDAVQCTAVGISVLWGEVLIDIGCWGWVKESCPCENVRTAGFIGL